MKHSIFAPRQVRQTNVNLVRSQAYPPAPWVTAQGVQQYQQQSQPVAYMPQAMAFGKYKTPPAGYAQARMGQSAVNVVEIGQQMNQRQRKLADAGRGSGAYMPPQPTIRRVAEPLNQLPPMQTEMNPRPWSRGVLERAMVQPSTNLMAMAANIASDPVAYSRNNYAMPRVGPPRMPDTYRVRPWAPRTGY
jgi:hypothetical protein